MADIDRYIDVTITRQTTTPTVASFDGVLIAADFADTDVTPNFTERVRSYSDLATIGTQFGTSHPVYGMAASIFGQSVTVDKVYVGRVTTAAPETWTAGLDAIKAENNLWYGLVTPERTLADLQTITDWAEINKKLCVISDDDSNIISGTGDIAEYIQTNTYDYSAVIYHSGADGNIADPFADGAWIGALFPKDPGSATWAWKTLKGVTADDLTEAQIDTLEGKNGNYYVEIAGVPVVHTGQVGSGEFIDIIRGQDWLNARIQELVVIPLLNSDKIPYTNAGVGVITSQIKKALGEAVDRSYVVETYTDSDNNIQPGWTVTAPEVSTISATDKGNRLLPDITFTAILAGAIHTTQINGTLTL
jgi:hypothetical protein